MGGTLVGLVGKGAGGEARRRVGLVGGAAGWAGIYGSRHGERPQWERSLGRGGRECPPLPVSSSSWIGRWSGRAGGWVAGETDGWPERGMADTMTGRSGGRREGWGEGRTVWRGSGAGWRGRGSTGPRRRELGGWLPGSAAGWKEGRQGGRRGGTQGGGMDRRTAGPEVGRTVGGARARKGPGDASFRRQVGWLSGRRDGRPGRRGAGREDGGAGWTEREVGKLGGRRGRRAGMGGRPVGRSGRTGAGWYEGTAVGGKDGPTDGRAGGAAVAPGINMNFQLEGER